MFPNTIEYRSSALEEYKILRSEVELKMQLTNTLTLAMVTAVTACVVAGFQFKCRFIFLVAIGFIIPISQRVMYYDRSLQQIVSYMRVFLEPACGIQWETRRKELSDYVAANSDMDPNTTVHHKLCTRKKRKAFNAVFKDAMFLYGIDFAAFIVYSIREMLCWQSYQCISWWIFTITYAAGFGISGVFLRIQTKKDAAYHRTNDTKWIQCWKGVKKEEVMTKVSYENHNKGLQKS